ARTLTFNDYKLLNRMYNCAGVCTTVPICRNGGYPSPKYCTCKCPDFFTGASCEFEKSVININATTSGTISFYVPYDPVRYQNQNNFKYNNWDLFRKDNERIIKAPVGKRIRVSINRVVVDKEPCILTCPYFGLEIVDTANGDLTSVGKTFCCPQYNNYSFVSKTNIIGYRAFVSPGMYFNSSVIFTVV
ncbi:hypothetical protein PENTCL1PPCAC_10836, partial [Pristionchus entomophagus]